MNEPPNGTAYTIAVGGDRSCLEPKRYLHCQDHTTYAAAAPARLNRDLPPGYSAEWTKHFAEPKQIEERQTHSAVIFRIGPEWLALPASIFEQVGEMRTIHSLPHQRTAVVLGIVNVSGELLTCISLGKVLGLEEQDLALAREKQGRDLARLMTIRSDGRRVVYPAHEVHGLHRYNKAEVQSVPATLAKAATSYTKGILPRLGKAIGLLDEDLIFRALNRSLA